MPAPWRRRSRRALAPAAELQKQEDQEAGSGDAAAVKDQTRNSKNDNKKQSTSRPLSRKMVNSLTRPKSNKTVSGSPHVCLVLVSSLCSRPQQEAEQRRCRDLFNSKGLTFIEVDGADEANAHKRDFLFGVSKERGCYPQVFLANPETGMHKFVGTWPTIEQLLECNDIESSFLMQHPEIRTFDVEFASVEKGKPTTDLPTVW